MTKSSNMKAESTGQTTESLFKPYEYQVEREQGGWWRALYREYPSNEWKSCYFGFDYMEYERAYLFKRNAIKACHKHANSRLKVFKYVSEKPTYLGRLP